MNVESTIETSALVTPNSAIDKRSQTSSYKMLQNPETKKNTKNHAMKQFLRRDGPLLLRKWIQSVSSYTGRGNS
jgi:hypothetical protein